MLELERLCSFPLTFLRSRDRQTPKLLEDAESSESLKMRVLDYTEGGNGLLQEMHQVHLL